MRTKAAMRPAPLSFKAAGCPCEGRALFRSTAMPLLVYACHCTECQRWSGSGLQPVDAGQDRQLQP